MGKRAALPTYTDDEIPTSTKSARLSDEEGAPITSTRRIDRFEVIVIDRLQPADAERLARFEANLALAVANECNCYIGFVDNLKDEEIFIPTDTPRPMGAKADVVIMLPDETPIRVGGTVTWSRTNKTAGMWICLDDLPEEEAELLRAFSR